MVDQVKNTLITMGNLSTNAAGFNPPSPLPSRNLLFFHAMVCRAYCFAGASKIEVTLVTKVDKGTHSPHLGLAGDGKSTPSMFSYMVERLRSHLRMTV